MIFQKNIMFDVVMIIKIIDVMDDFVQIFIIIICEIEIIKKIIKYTLKWKWF